MGQESWVTFIRNDEEGMQVFRLIVSLKASSTSRPVVVLLTENVGKEIRELLERAVHLVVVQPSKLHLWELTQFSKCVYLDPHLTVEGNCDELFALEEFLLVRPDVACPLLKVFGFKPNAQTWHDLLAMAINHQDGSAFVTCTSNLNPKIKLTSGWEDEVLRAGISSFALGGNNAHAIFQSVPLPLQPTQSSSISRERPGELIPFSAKSPEALEALTLKYVEFCENDEVNSLEDLSNLAFSASTTRAHLEYRVACYARNIADLEAKLKAGDFEKGNSNFKEARIGFLFSGQGCQYAGMAAELLESSPIFRQFFQKCDSLLKGRLGVSLKEICDSAALQARAVYCHPAIFCIEYCIGQLWAELGLRPHVVLGHSLGEFAATVMAGLLSLEDALNLVIDRSELVGNLGPGAMLVLRTSESKVKALFTDFLGEFNPSWLDISAVNAEDQVVVSGPSKTVSEFGTYCSELGMKVNSLASDYAYHSRSIDRIMGELEGRAKGIKYSSGSPNAIYISSSSGNVMQASDFSPEYWASHLRYPVQFSKAMAPMTSEKCDIIVEIGPSPILLPLALAANPKALCVPSIRPKLGEWASFSDAVGKLYTAGLDFNWPALFEGLDVRRIPLPLYPFQRSKYWVDDAEEDEGHETGFRGPLLHPLLGYEIPTAGKERVFQNTLYLGKLEYLRDHRLGGTVVLPAAAFIEIIMAGGTLGLLTEIGCPVILQNFLVLKALALQEGGAGAVVIQAIVSERSEEGVEVGVYAQVKGQAPSWVKHASGIVSLPAPEALVLSQLDFDTVTSTSPNINMCEVYEKLAGVGYNFGPRFQSMAIARRNDLGTFTTVRVPEWLGAGYLVHPILLDALLQTTMLENEYNHDQILLPVTIRKLLFPGRVGFMSGDHLTCAFEKGSNRLGLFTSEGHCLISLEGLDFMPTNLANLKKSWTPEPIPPPFYFQTWLPDPAQTSSFLEKADKDGFSPSLEAGLKSFLLSPQAGLELTSSSRSICKLAFLYMIRGIQLRGWLWTIGQRLEVITTEWNSMLPAKLKHFKLVASYLHFFREEGYVNLDIVLKPLPSVRECEAELAELAASVRNLLPVESADIVTLDLVIKCGEALPLFLDGGIDGLSILFPSDKVELGAPQFYTSSKICLAQLRLSTEALALLLSEIEIDTRRPLRVLEVGAGTGSASKPFQLLLSQAGIPHVYTFTDVSPYFLNQAKKEFGSRFSYKVLDLERDPLHQGFPPNTFDIVLGFQVVHATKYLSQSMRHIHLLLRPGGVVLLGESFEQDPGFHLIFGMLDGWWRFEDFRETSPIATADEWERVLNTTGFPHFKAASHPSGMGVLVAKSGEKSIMEVANIGGARAKTWLILADNSRAGTLLKKAFLKIDRSVLIVRLGISNEAHGDVFTIPNDNTAADFSALLQSFPDEEIEGVMYVCTEPPDGVDLASTQRRICGTLLSLLQGMSGYFDGKDFKPKFILLTRGSTSMEETEEELHPDLATLAGLSRNFAVEFPLFEVKHIDLEAGAESPQNNEIETVLSLLWGKGEEQRVAVRGGHVFLQRLKEEEGPGIVRLKIPPTPHFNLTFPENSIESAVLRPVRPSILAPSEVEIEVKSAGINFRDLFLILKPDGFDGRNCLPGLEVAGLVSRRGTEVKEFEIGEQVFGIVVGGGFSTHVITPQLSLTRIPVGLDFSSAAAVPVIFSTAYSALVQIAKLTRGETVLIHSASGGVGLAAVLIAKAIGARILGTAGSLRKRAYLKSIGVDGVYNSRNTNYFQQIGEGKMDVLLNTLTSEGFKEASLGVCAQGARFIEISKINVWSVDDVAELRPDVSYTILDLWVGVEKDERLWRGMWPRILETVSVESFQDFPVEEFPLDLTPSAFNFMKAAKHIGKIVVQIPTPTKSNLFRENSTYLISGGMGGIGLEVLEWMVARGAKHIVLVGRRPPNPRALAVIQSLSSDCQVLILQANVGDRFQCAGIFQKTRKAKYPPIRGIMHAAGALSDGMISNQSWTKFEAVFQAKVYGAWNLHNLTLGSNLEFFVMFSSFAAQNGSKGQSNHCAANSFQDSLASYRHSLGLTASSINWGVWGDVGTVLNVQNFGLDTYAPAFTAMEGIAGLEKFMEGKYFQATLAHLNVPALRQDYKLGNYLMELKGGKGGGVKLSNVLAALEAQVLESLKSGNLAEETLDQIEKYLDGVLKYILRMPEGQSIQEGKNFVALGLDSLMAMEFRNKVMGIMGEKTLPLSSIQDYPNKHLLAEYIFQILSPGGFIEN